MNIDKQRKNECLDAECGFTKNRCLIFHGRECVKLGGKRIPLQSATAKDRKPLEIEAQTTFKAYWIRDEWAMNEGREF